MNYTEIARLQEYLVILKKYQYLAAESANIKDESKRHRFNKVNHLINGLCFFAARNNFYDAYFFWANYLLQDAPSTVAITCQGFDRFYSRCKGLTLKRIELVDTLIYLIEEVLEKHR